jgi:membrane-associated phospholipid phosphatase
MPAVLHYLIKLRSADHAALHWASQKRHPALNTAMQAFSAAGNWQTWTMITGVALIAGERPRQIAIRVLPRLLIVCGVSLAFKIILQRPRPTQSIKGFQSLLKNPDPYSLPSLHSACAWSVCTSLGVEFKRAWPLLATHALLISYSRVYVGVHYPLDVVTGACIGITVALVS